MQSIWTHKQKEKNNVAIQFPPELHLEMCLGMRKITVLKFAPDNVTEDSGEEEEEEEERDSLLSSMKSLALQKRQQKVSKMKILVCRKMLILLIW